MAGGMVEGTDKRAGKAGRLTDTQTSLAWALQSCEPLKAVGKEQRGELGGSELGRFMGWFCSCAEGEQCLGLHSSELSDAFLRFTQFSLSVFIRWKTLSSEIKGKDCFFKNGFSFYIEFLPQFQNNFCDFWGKKLLLRVLFHGLFFFFFFWFLFFQSFTLCYWMFFVLNSLKTWRNSCFA